MKPVKVEALEAKKELNKCPESVAPRRDDNKECHTMLDAGEAIFKKLQCDNH